MEEIKVTKTIEEIVGYKSVDGRRFTTKEQCEKWESSLEGMVEADFKRISEETTFYALCGGDEWYKLIKVSISNANDLETLRRYIAIYHEEYGLDRIEEVAKAYTTDLIGKTIILRTTEDRCWFDNLGTTEEYMKRVNDELAAFIKEVE